MQEVKILADAVDDVPDLVGFVGEDRHQLQTLVTLHDADGLASVSLVVAQVHSGRGDGIGEVGVAVADLDRVVHRIRSVSRGLIAVDGDTLNPTLGYLQQENAFFCIFFFGHAKTCEILRKMRCFLR